ncbi:hypothetical protein PRJ39_14645 [Lysobacter enzymogenes]|uniref:hypothetical protein n=1 Tax=Lysobacter enzymogenes TaxID=69 RepID=UPI003747C18A
MITDVQNALNTILGNVACLKNAKGAGRIFELFVMTGVAKAIKTGGYDVWLKRSDGSRIYPANTLRDFIQRGGGPAGIPAMASGASNASCIAFQKDGSKQVWEMWNGVQFEGRSKALHEFDVAVIPFETAEALRNWEGGRPRGRPRIAIECKDVATSGSIDEIRTLVARLYDVTILDCHAWHLGLTQPSLVIYPGILGSWHYSSASFYEENTRCCNVFARKTGFAKGAVAMTGYHLIRPYAFITSAGAQAATLFTEVADWINKKMI